MIKDVIHDPILLAGKLEIATKGTNNMCFHGVYREV